MARGFGVRLTTSGTILRNTFNASRHFVGRDERGDLDWQNVVTAYESNVMKVFGATLFNWSCSMNDNYKKVDPYPHVH
ncbi:MAG: hypothetical protein NVSMB39_5050 [Candidatus Saccharimonadales bacterium]